MTDTLNAFFLGGSMDGQQVPAHQQHEPFICFAEPTVPFKVLDLFLPEVPQRQFDRLQRVTYVLGPLVGLGKLGVIRFYVHESIAKSYGEDASMRLLWVLVEEAMRARARNGRMTQP